MAKYQRALINTQKRNKKKTDIRTKKEDLCGEIHKLCEQIHEQIQWKVNYRVYIFTYIAKN